MWYTSGAMDYVYKRSEFTRPPAQLEHVDMALSFYEDRVEASGTLHCRAREAMREIALDCDGNSLQHKPRLDICPGALLHYIAE